MLELASGVAGPYAGRLLAMLGATVAKVEPPDGDPARWQPIDDEPLSGLSPLYRHLNYGKQVVAEGEVGLDWPHVVIDDRVHAEVAGSDLDPDRLDGCQLVSVTPWGFDASAGGQMSDELLVQAASGFIGLNGDADGPPLRLPGWPSQYFAGACAAVAAQSALRMDVSHVDVSWLGAFLRSVEITYADALHCQRQRPRPGAHPPMAFPSGALPCKDGYVTPASLRAIDWEMQCLFYGLPELIDDPEYSSRHRRAEHVDELWERIKPWYAERTKAEIFQLALETPWGVGMVMTPLEVIADRHMVERGYLGDDGVPLAPCRGDGLPVDDGVSVKPGAAPRRALQPARQLRLIEMTIAWAGPFVGNLLGPLGVEIIKIEAQAPFDGMRQQRPYDHGMPPGFEHLQEDNRFFEANGLFNAFNRNKRDCVIDASTDDGRQALLDLAANSDGIVANFSAHVLPALGLDWATLREVNPGLVVVRMPAFGCVGPYADAVGNGSVIEAMGGIGARHGYEHEAARISNVYYPDPIAGVHAAVAWLAGLDRRDRTGEGCEIDLSHQEATWLFSGEALVLAATEGRNIGRTGNRVPGAAVSGVYATADGRWVAVVGPDACGSVVGRAGDLDAEELIAAVHAADGGAELILDPWTAPDGPRLAPFLETVDHPVTGPGRYIASPFVVDGMRLASTRYAPRFDEHTDEVLAEVAGYSVERIAALRATGAVGGTLPSPRELDLV